MVIRTQRMEQVPTGAHTGVVVSAEEDTRDFGRGAEPQVVLVIQADYKPKSGLPTFPLEVLFTPSLNGVSGLSRAIERLGHKLPPDGGMWEPRTLKGTKVRFNVLEGKAGFVKVDKDSLEAA